MAAPSYTYTITNGTAADASQVTQNFNDILNGVTDGTKDLTINALEVNGAAQFDGNVTLGDSPGDDVTINGSLASSVSIKTQYTYDLGSATLGLRSIYFGSSDSAGRGTRLIGGTVASNWTLTLPTAVPTESDSALVATAGGVSSWRNRDMHEKNFILNGAFDFWQRGTSLAGATNGAYQADRWAYVKATTGAAHTMSRETTILPTLAESGFQSSYALKVDCTTADAAVAAGDLVAIRQQLEGYAWAALRGNTVTLTFWVYATKTGTYCVSFMNNGNDRSYVAEYTVSTTNTWEKKTITATLNPSGGTDDYTTGAGLKVAFALMAGSTYQTTAGAWQTGQYFATSNQVNACDADTNNFYLAQVMLNLGGSAAPMARAGHTIGEELALCQRYYEKSYNVTADPATVTDGGICLGRAINTQFEYTVKYKVRKRTNPTVTLYSNATGASGNIRNASTAADVAASAASPSEDGNYLIVTTAGADNRCAFHYTADAEF